jgi:endonuclease/exonuclease/phosphatase family metal-dependent hydrolase
MTVARTRFKTRICEGRAVAGWSGLALLSRESWVEQDVLHLPSDERDGERIALIGVTFYEDRQVILANTHLTHLRDADDLRRTQLETVLAHPLLNQPGSLRLLCGDLNTTADGPVLSPFLDGSRTPRLRDTYTLGGGSEPRGTLAPLPGDPDPSQRPCIDFILALEDGDGAPLAFQDSRIVLNRPRPNTEIYPSDHFGVMTTITQT